jgi:cbb3-type cytochrome oxidase subunit 3
MNWISVMLPVLLFGTLALIIFLLIQTAFVLWTSKAQKVGEED